MAVDDQGLEHDNFDDKTFLLSDDEISDLDCNDEHFSLMSSIDDIVENVKIGLFHYLIVTACGLCYGGYSSYYQAIGLIIITACDLNINAANKGWLSTSVMIGIIVGTFLFGGLADIYGRRKLILIALLINLISMLASVLAYNYIMLATMAAFIGISYGAVFAIVHPYAIEFFPRRYRGLAGTCASGFCIVLSIYSCLIALAILPHPFHLPFGLIYFNNWRLYLFISMIPTLVGFCIMIFMPNSLRFVLMKKDKRNVLVVLEKIDRINSCYLLCHRSTNQQYHTLESVINRIDIDNSKLNAIQHKQDHFIQHFRTLMKPPWRKRLFLLSITYFGYLFSDQGFLIWLPTVLSFYVSGKTCRNGQHHAIYNITMNTTHSTSMNTLDCYNSQNLMTVIFDLLIGNVLCIPLTILCILLIDRVGRKLLYCLIAIMSGLSILLMWLIDSYISTIILSCIFVSFTATAWIPAKTWTSELFCTEIRSTAAGLLNCIGYIGSMLGMTTFVLLFHVNCTATFMIFGLLGLVAVIMTFFLPDTTKANIG